MINYIYSAKYISGGAIGALDRIPSDQLTEGDSAIVITEDGKVYFYSLNATIGDTTAGDEQPPKIISPDDINAGSKRWVLASTIFSDVTAMEDLRVKGNLFVEKGFDIGDIWTNKSKGLLAYGDSTFKGKINVEDDLDIQNLDVHETLTVHDDATVKNNLRVEGYIGGGSPVEIIGGLNVSGAGTAHIIKVSDDLTVHDDATIKGDLHVDKRLFGRGITVAGPSDVKLDISDDVIIRDDATIKDNLYVDGIIFGTVDGISTINEAQDFKVHKDLIVQDDSTIKDQLVVEGRIKGSIESAISSQEAQDFKVNKDLIVQDDSTIKDDLRVEGLIFGTLADAPIPATHDHNYSDTIFHDTTLKNNMRVEGEIVGYAEDSHTHPNPTEAQDFKVFKDLVVQDDATVKNNFLVEKNVHIEEDATVRGNFVVSGDSYVDNGEFYVINYGTRKAKLIGDGLYLWNNRGSFATDQVTTFLEGYMRIRFNVTTDNNFGLPWFDYNYYNKRMTHSSGIGYLMYLRAKNAMSGTAGFRGFTINITPETFGSGINRLFDVQIDGTTWFNIDFPQGYDPGKMFYRGGFDLLGDILTKKDATVKGDLVVENDNFVYDDRKSNLEQGITEDFTTQGIVFKIVKGLIVNAHYKSG